VVGGCCSEYFASAEVYDPEAGTWTSTGSLTTGRDSHTATLLPSGKILVAGGRNERVTAISSAELYDPATGIWTATGSLNQARSGHTAILLLSGQVLVASGHPFEDVGPDSAELYDPDTET
jgi:hypothetical protein